MTDFTIPEEAVGAAFIAARAASASALDLDDVSIGAMTAAIAAALPVMFERVGWIGGNDPSLMNDDWGATTPIIYSAKTSNDDVAIFRAKEPK